jgi:hypothetical protein
MMAIWPVPHLSRAAGQRVRRPLEGIAVVRLRSTNVSHRSGRHYTASNGTAGEALVVIDHDALAEELRSLRKGRGMRHVTVLTRLGPETKRLFQINESDGAVAARAKATATVNHLLRDETREVRLAVLAALALHPETTHRDLSGRRLWLARQLHCQERTARRRVDEAFELLVQAAAESDLEAVPDPPALHDWHIRRMDAVLRLDVPSPELIDRRTITFVKSGIGEIVAQLSLPRPSRDASQPHDVHAEIQYGGQIRARERPADQYFRWIVELPRRFCAGETHDYGIVYRLPPGQSMAPHYVLQPLAPCEAFDVTVRFDPNRLPRLVWRLNGVVPRVIDEDRPVGETVQPDRFGEVHLTFRNLLQGFAYGVKWTM